MFALFRGEGVQNEDVYVDLVKQEGHAFSILIVRDLVYLAVKGGNVKKYLWKNMLLSTWQKLYENDLFHHVKQIDLEWFLLYVI